MHEHIAHTVYYLGVHLLYASMVWLAALALTSAVRSSATVKYWIWVMTSLNFLLPVGAVLDQSFGRYLSWAAPLRVIGPLGIAAADHSMLISALWFHPLLWFAGSRLALYRELSCDEAVIQRDQGKDLVAALAKLANPESALLLQGAAASHMSRRVARLIAAGPRSCFAVNTLLLAVFAAVLFLGVFETVAHTACCFVGR